MSASLNLVLIGPPGSGKGTQAVRLARRYRVPHISTGDILRQAVRDDTPLGRQVAATIAAGRSSATSSSRAWSPNACRAGIPSRGSCSTAFPARSTQTQVLDKMRDHLIVVHIAAPDEEIIKRLSSRRICESCALTQSVSDTGNNEDCPYCGGRLVRREDDDPETVRKRLKTYAALAGPLIEIYSKRPGFIAVDGLQVPDKVTADLYAAIDARR